MAKIKYRNNDPQVGIEYDWDLVRDELCKLGIPADYYNPATAPLEAAQWFVEISERATGKTTGWLLLGAVLHWLYGSVTIYLRSTKDQIAPKNASSLFNVILDNGYISKLTNGEYNHITYRSRKWYFCKIDDGGNETLAPTYFCRVVSIDEGSNLKSSFNEPTGDLIIFDEFIPIDNRYQRPNEFVQLVDVISTIFRLRETGKIVLLANNIDRDNQYFNDLEISDIIYPMETGQKTTYITDRGTRIYIEFIGSPQVYRKRKLKWVKLFAGFGKKELASVTGEDTWSVKMYQHIPDVPSDDVEFIEPLCYIYHNHKYIRIDITRLKDVGLCLFAHMATKTRKDSIILTRIPIYEPNHYRDLGPKNLERCITKFVKAGLVYFSANNVGSLFEKYLNECGVVTDRTLRFMHD